jgi:hypothetical protein
LNKKDGNFLDLIPEKDCNWGTSDDGRIYLQVPRFKNPFFKRVARRLGKSEQVKIFFDEIGGKSWLLIDGRRTVQEIGQLMEKDMGESVKPVYERLTQFISILFRNKFIFFNNY